VLETRGGDKKIIMIFAINKFIEAELGGTNNQHPKANFVCMFSPVIFFVSAGAAGRRRVNKNSFFFFFLVFKQKLKIKAIIKKILF
jgi:hypothetical protein